MMFKVVLKRGVARDLRKLSKKDKIRIYKAIERLEDPFLLDVRKIRGLEDTYAVRVGDFRIVFKVYFDKRIVLVTRIDRRERIYDRL
ncbi:MULTISPECIES: type II toxin-antitoxin system RelE family toxin [unclassified Archaeoglobus]|uniref:type II toxin-antitoxin system RelE family toxin n=1 Tax=unclassified Archaeoglobus TaxID=2643606 RepID=UPI0025B971A2|nr:MULTISPECIES: type II toxin-antitoxin system RelE/ParE family toxin [unclassified Archaeoglobus]